MRPIPSARHQHAAASRGVRRAFQADGVSRHELEADREALVQVHSSIPALDEGLVLLSCMFFLLSLQLAVCALTSPSVTVACNALHWVSVFRCEALC